MTKQVDLDNQLVSQLERLRQQLRYQNQQLNETNSRITYILENIGESCISLDLDWQVTYVNKAAEKILKMSKQALYGKCIWSFFPHYEQVFKKPMTHALQKGIDLNHEIRFTKRWFEFHISPYYNGLTVLCRDITERKLAQEALRLSEERFAKAFNSSPSIMYLADSNSRFVDVNSSFERVTGYSRSEVLGLNPADINLWTDSNGQITLMQEFLHQGKTSNFETQFVTKTGQVRTGLFSSEVIEVGSEEMLLVVGNDITEIKTFKQEMARLDRLNSIGQMAASISHEVRNPMTTVRGFLQMFGERGEYYKDRELFDLMIQELDRANWIISQFLSLSGNRETQEEFVNLNKMLEDIHPLLAADALTSDKYVEIVKGDVPDLLLNKKEIHQLILNLVRNGLEAMEEHGSVIIKTYREGDFTVLSVSDQGKGIPKGVLDKIGTPFITTKESGTGIGLAVCYSIAARNNAKIQVETGARGTTFRIRFKPKVDQANSLFA